MEDTRNDMAQESVLFWDVDTQYDFMDPEGKLYVPGAETRDDNLAALTETAQDYLQGGSVDAHIPEDDEFEVFPEHCVYGTPGQRKIGATDDDAQYVPAHALTDEQVEETVEAMYDGEQTIVEKRSPDPRDNDNLDAIVDAVDPDHVVVYGVVSEICVDEAVDYFTDREGTDVHVVEDAIMHLDEDDRDACYGDWQDAGAGFVGTEEVINEDLDFMED